MEIHLFCEPLSHNKVDEVISCLVGLLIYHDSDSFIARILFSRNPLVGLLLTSVETKDLMQNLFFKEAGTNALLLIFCVKSN